MQAAVFHLDDRKLVVEDVPEPTPGIGQVVVRAHRCGICGSDLHMAQGHGASFADGTIPGHKVAGEVVAIGSGVTRVAIGDTVAVLPLLSCGTCVSCQVWRPRRLRHGADAGLT